MVKCTPARYLTCIHASLESMLSSVPCSGSKDSTLSVTLVILTYWVLFSSTGFLLISVWFWISFLTRYIASDWPFNHSMTCYGLCRAMKQTWIQIQLFESLECNRMSPDNKPFYRLSKVTQDTLATPFSHVKSKHNTTLRNTSIMTRNNT